VTDFDLPAFLIGVVEPERYMKWLRGRARAHGKRDDGRGHAQATVKNYMRLIHEAVIASNGRDYYTGQPLDWNLIGTYSNTESKRGRHAYKRKFDRMPSVDHEVADATSATFRICGWSTNDSKHAMCTQEFTEMAGAILEHAGWTVTPPTAK